MTVVFNAHRSRVHVVVSYCLFTLSFAWKFPPLFPHSLPLSLSLSVCVVILFYLVHPPPVCLTFFFCSFDKWYWARCLYCIAWEWVCWCVCFAAAACKLIYSSWNDQFPSELSLAEFWELHQQQPRYCSSCLVHFRMIRSSVLQGSRLHEFGDEQNHCCFPIISLL